MIRHNTVKSNDDIQSNRESFKLDYSQLRIDKKREGDLTGFDNTSENYFCRMIRVTCG